MLKEESKYSNLLRIVATSSFVLLFATFVGKILNYLYKMVLARYAGPEIFGRYSLALIVAGWFVAFAGLGVPEGLLRFIPFYKGKKDYSSLKFVFKSSLTFLTITSLFFGILMFILADFISIKIFHDIYLAKFIRYFSLTVPLTIITGPYMDCLLSFKLIKEYSFISNVYSGLVRITLFLGIIILGFTDYSIIVSHIAGVLFVLIAAHTVFSKKINFLSNTEKISLTKKKKIFSELIKYSWPLLFLSIVSSFFYWIDSLFIGRYLNTFEVGIYNSATPIAMLLGFVPSLVMTILFPMINGEYAKKNFENIKNLSRKVGKWIFIINLPIFTMFIMFPGAFLNLLFGSEYIVASSALIILSFGSMIYSIGVVSLSLVSMSGKSKLVFLDFLAGVLLNIVLVMFLIPSLGINGAAIGTSASYLLVTLLLLIQSRNVIGTLPVEINKFRAFAIFMIFILISLLIKIFINLNLINMIVISIFLLSIYFLFIIKLKVIDKEDKEIILSLFQSLIFKGERVKNKFIR